MATVSNCSPTLGWLQRFLFSSFPVTRVKDCAFSGAVLLFPERGVCVSVGLCSFGMVDAGSHKGRVE